MVASGKRIKESRRVTYSAKVLHGSLAGSAPKEQVQGRKFSVRNPKMKGI